MVAFAAVWCARRSSAADPATTPMPLTATTENADIGIATNAAPAKTWATTEGVTIATYAGPDAVAEKGDIVVVEYIGRLTNGTIFDSSFKHQPPDPLTFVLGSGNVIKGWDIGVVGMHVGEIRKLTIPPNLAYGKAGAGDGTIPPDATLEFMVKLVGLRKGN